MLPNTSNDNPAGASDLAAPQIADCGESGLSPLPEPFLYYRANMDGSIEWEEDCVCQDNVYENTGDDESPYHGGKAFSEAQVLALLVGRATPGIREAAPEGMILAPHYRGYARLGTGQYLLNNSATGSEAELVISIATDEEKAGRVVGDERDNVPGNLIQPDVMAVRIAFTTVAGLDALENQLRKLRAEHFSAAEAQS